MKLKKILSIILLVAMLAVSALSMTSCDLSSLQGEQGEDEKVGDTSDIGETETLGTGAAETGVSTEGSNKVEGKKEYRVLLTSDMHYTSLSKYYGLDSDTRLQFWVDGILREHKQKPFDLIIIVGDTSLDYHGWKRGTYQQNPPVSETKIFMEKYVSQLPEEVPIVVLPGNHELYTNAKWKEITGNDRNESFVLGENLFIMPDSFSGAVDPEYVGGGKNDAPYAAVDMSFIQGEIDKHPECKNIFLVSHHFNLSKESEAFKTLLKTEERIVGLFSGHTHSNTIKSLGAEYNNLCIAQTGSFRTAGDDETVSNFAFGYRDLIIQEEQSITSYIIPECEYYVKGVKHTSERNISNIKKYDLSPNT